ncbi:DUF4184 family protein [Microbacterium yannicii]|uniref:DUF4184 family protein n=1 Tax=Microbacterium yannicii TaxID=671622 RepID=A0ABP9MXI9_9MICO|nr:DUF4184 family protein [Microbacterium yannicii]MCO5953060.1 DUF4184 family protein [Microbacterium yannicii]
MPFTPSHAVVALPFVRTPLVPAAIAIGAMTPDLPLFVRGLPLHYGRTHAFGWLPATVLLALVLLLAWRCVLRPAARELSPRWLAVRLPGEWDAGAGAAWRETFSIPPAHARRAPWTGMLLLVLSLLIGVVTHIVWDLFTHEGRWGSVVIPALGAEWGPLPGYKWLQHGSSAIGLAIIGVWMLVWLRRRQAAASVPRVLTDALRWVWWASLPVVLAVAWVWGLAVHGPLDAEFTSAHLAYRVLPPACAVWGAATVVVCIVIQVLRAQSAAQARPT